MNDSNNFCRAQIGPFMKYESVQPKKYELIQSMKYELFQLIEFLNLGWCWGTINVFEWGEQ